MYLGKQFLVAGEIYKSGQEPRAIVAKVGAPTLHFAKRLLLQDVLAHGFWVKYLKEASPEDMPAPPEQWENE